MRYLSGKEEQEALEYISQAAAIALQATCQRDCCGSLIVKNNEVIGRGFNSPPANQENQRRCSCSKDSYHKKVKDTTCCIHAEQRAIMDALKNNPDKISGARLYFVRLDAEGMPTKA
jgi:deoxycytidylate deaminase